MRQIKYTSPLLVLSLSVLPGMLYANAQVTQTQKDNWTGFYVGVIGGGSFNDADVKANHLGFANPSSRCDGSTSFNSFYPGVQVGTAKQFDSNWVLGFLGDYTYNSNHDTSYSCPCPGAPDIADTLTASNKMQGSVLGKLGYAYHNWLPYIDTGVSFADARLTYLNEEIDFYQTSKTVAGFRIGGGLEWAIAPSWSITAEYHYITYDSMRLHIPKVSGLIDVNGGATLNLSGNNVQLALNYWFN